MPRKRANVTKKKNEAEVKAPPKYAPLINAESQYFQELVDVSNRYGSLVQQKKQFEFVVSKLQEDRKKIQKDEIKLPLMMTLIPNLVWYPEDNKKKIFKFYDTQITQYQNSIKSLEGQITHRHEEYLESAVRNREFMIRRYGKLKAKQLVQDRKIVTDEENLFEAEFKKLMDDPKTMEEFTKKKKMAVKINTERAKRKKKRK